MRACPQRRLQQKCEVANTWTSQGRTYVMAPSGAADCSNIDGCAATQILDYTACEIAQDACYSQATLRRMSGQEAQDACYSQIRRMSGQEAWDGPRGCHVQDGQNWQFNANGEEGSAPGHTPVCLLDGSADLDPEAINGTTTLDAYIPIVPVPIPTPDDPSCPVNRDYCTESPLLPDNCDCGDCGFSACGDCDCDYYGENSNCCTHDSWHECVDEGDYFSLFVLVVWTVAIVSLRCAGLCLANRWKQPAYAAPPQAVVGVAHGP